MESNSVYVDTAGAHQEKSDLKYGDEKDNLFSLSSTMPDKVF